MFEINSIENKVISKDGTPIAFRQSGRGPALVLIHGSGADRSRWAAVLNRLNEHFTVYSVDRRGRGESGDGPVYSIEREYEDILALTSAIDGPVDVLGHSFGAACVLGAAAQIPNLRRLVIYEPPMLHEQQTPQRAGLIQRMDQALAEGNREGVVLIMMTEMMGLPGAAVDRLRVSPAWACSVAAAHTFPRELRYSDAYGDRLEALRGIRAPTLFLLGSESPNHFKITTDTLMSLMPNHQLALLTGQQHSAMLTAPNLFADVVIPFLTA